MSWLTGLAGKAEELLNKVDQSAATALNADDGTSSPSTLPSIVTHTETTQISDASKLSSTAFAQNWAPPQTTMSYSGSVPANLNRISAAGRTKLNSKPVAALPPVTTTAAPTTITKNDNKKDMDAELFEFLNSSSTNDSPATGRKRLQTPTGSKHSRQSSASSTTSGKSSRTLDTANTGSADNVDDGSGFEPNDTADLSTNDVAVNNDSSSGYHSNQEDSGATMQQQQLSSLELENQLLKNEVASLNQEMSSIMQRARDAQEAMLKMQRQGELHQSQLSQSDQVVRELQSKESDWQEALRAKDSQLAVLRVRLDEVDKDLRMKQSLIDSVQAERDRILQDHTSVSGVQSHALDSMKEKLNDAELALQHEKQGHARFEQEVQERQSRLEQEKHNMAEALSAAQRKANEEKGRCTELSGQLRSTKSNADSARQELTDYKEKATRILQSKDRLIASLKEGVSGGGDVAVSPAELDDMKQERDILRDELLQSRMTIENLRVELQDLESQMQQDSDAVQDEVRALEEQLSGEKQRREDTEQELARHKQELRYAHEELLKQKTALQGRLQDRDTEIDRLRNQLTTKSMNSSSQVELENRLHSLTESLIQKQTMLEALSTEKNSLVLQLERLEKQYRESEAAAVRASAVAVVMNEEDEVRQRMPGFMRVMPQDGNVARKVKKAAYNIDRFSIRLGVFLRRYPIARIFVIIYMVMLHVWVMIVLLTYQPEVHGVSFNPKPPEK
ncbi:Golgin subfamily A member 5 [Lamellibrachia satsuma]|nr:Golgin subfamily A member 5 [Lamellibrachia satsuma]